ncbi:hypothetical protein PF010_g3067 [Phytophthora fragariae]|uniref:Beta-glucan synthesis-associated protein n=1 Tax=Phytophthora fragariae TaxID=53985 RepID=A0A6G0LV87_9STRA|nr:hypothetical protein PF010_g3067 [Phytophthora fragariae]
MAASWLRSSLLATIAVIAVVDASSSSSSSDSDSSSTSGSDSTATDRSLVKLGTRSGIRPWVDPDTPDDVRTYVTSRGDTWELVLSDEFGDVSRNFSAGGDHLWTSLEMPDGTNDALQLYSHDMTSVECDDDEEGLCYLQIKSIDEVNNITVWNSYLRPPAYQNSTFYYRSGMLQTWNKFCFQGGMLEVRAKLPAVLGNDSGNPDIGKSNNARAKNTQFYPTWPGIWLMGNLGRALFSSSTARMWPFSYSECNETVFNSSNQRISACDPDPGHGMNPYQGRGAVEIDLLEGGGVAISSSIQIAPGMPADYRRAAINETLGDYSYCMYSHECATTGANLPGVPTEYYEERGHQSWYQGLRYGSNNYCVVDGNDTQSYSLVAAGMKNITENTCGLLYCPASNDVHGDMGYIDGDKSLDHWNINSNGTCFPAMNGYQGVFLCDPDNQDSRCSEPRNDSTPKTNIMEPYNYQMDALSANWGIHMGAYYDYVAYQLEWVTGDNGYLRWMIGSHPIFEIPAEAVVDTPQGGSKPNPQLTFPEEPSYIILNVALSAAWGTYPPNPGKPCRGDGKDEEANYICDSFPLYMKIDYVRLYQDTSESSTMAHECDPASHPSRQWILDHLSNYVDEDNQLVEVHGGAPCRDYTDCTIPFSVQYTFHTGVCNADTGRCECINEFWGGPRCTFQLGATTANGEDASDVTFGPPLYAAFIVLGIVVFLTIVVFIVMDIRRRRKLVKDAEKANIYVEADMKSAKAMSSSSETTTFASTENDGDDTRMSPLTSGPYHRFR